VFPRGPQARRGSEEKTLMVLVVLLSLWLGNDFGCRELVMEVEPEGWKQLHMRFGSVGQKV